MAKERTGETVTEEDTQRQMALVAQREEERRDLLQEVEGIERDDSEILFQDTSPRRPMAIIYATLDGEPLLVTQKRARILFQRKLPDGRPMFRAKADQVPTYRKGDVKCFLHKDSPDRALMDSLGLQGKLCPAGQLANAYAKYIHESGKHVKTWDIWQKHVSDEKEKQAIERQDRQFEATMAQNEAILQLARSNQAAPVEVESCDVEGCVGFEGTPNQVRGHKLGAHK
jgi:hypothetical protein